MLAWTARRSVRRVGVRRDVSRWLSAKSQEEQQKQKSEEKKTETQEESKGFFSQLKEELKSNEDVKKTLEELNKKVDGQPKVGDVMDELKRQWGLGGSSSSDKTAGGSSAETKQEESSSQQTSNTEEKPSFKSRFRAARESLWAKLPASVGNDNQSWEDAFKEVFGVKVEKKKAPAPEEVEEWFEAVDKGSGDKYYYNAAGQTVWEKPTTGKIIKDADAEAHEWAEQEKEVKPTYFETKIKELGAEISTLENERDEAMAASDMAKFKELNKRIREIRKEIERVSSQANTTAIVHVEEKKGAWEQFNDRLRETPIIKNIFGIADSKVAQKARDAAEDAREALETSQNPLVYRMYSIYDSMFAETEMGEAIREFRKMDPDFTIEGFMEEMQDQIAPTVVRAFLEGDLKTLDGFCSEGAGAAVKASVKDRIAAGRKADNNILSIGEMHLAAAKVVDKMGPLIVVQFMVQQINCLYDLKGNAVEGKPDEIIGVFYVFALTREYDENLMEYRWKIKEFGIGGTTPYI